MGSVDGFALGADAVVLHKGHEAGKVECDAPWALVGRGFAALVGLGVGLGGNLAQAGGPALGFGRIAED